MGGLGRKVALGLGLGALVVAAALALGDADAVARALVGFDGTFLAWALAASAGNYVLRYLKWEVCLARLGVRADVPDLTWARSALVYLAGLSMSITPGKIGEVLRSVLLRATDGVPGSRTAPVVVADRLSDVLALVALSLFGLGRHADVPAVGLGAAAACLAIVLVVGSERRVHAILSFVGRVRALRFVAARAEAVAEASAQVLSVRVLFVLWGLSVAGWGLECVGLYAILSGFGTPPASLADATFLWSFTTLVGAVSFLPGGLGATEASLSVLVVAMVPGATPAVAVGATLLARGATLWFGEVVGVVALLVLRRHGALRRQDGDDGPPAQR